MGITFKEDVEDIRNSKVVDVIQELKDFGVHVDIVDPLANTEEVEHEYGVSLSKEVQNGHYDAVIVAVNHKTYKTLGEDYFIQLMKNNPVLIDVKGIYRNKFNNLVYWSL